MSEEQLRGRPPTAFQRTEMVRGVGKPSYFPRTVVLCVLVLGVALLGACGQGEEEGPAPEAEPASTATPLPAVVTFTPMPTSTNPPLPLPTETTAATPTPAIAATEPSPTEIAPPTSDAKVTVLGEMNIRSGPSTEYEVVGDAVAGEEFAITGKNEDGNWWQIDFRGESGWIYAPFVVAAEAEEVPVVSAAMTGSPDAEGETAESSPPTVIPIVNVGGDMNVRSGPGEEYDRIGGAFAGEEFAITGRNADGDWWQIDFEGQDGWIFAPFVTATDADNVPIVGSSMEGTPAPTTGTDTVARGGEKPIVTIDGDMNIRQGPGTDYARIGGATDGEEFDITGKSADGEWWQIDFGGEAGWVYAPFVTATNAENVPTVAAPSVQTPVAAPGPSEAGQAAGDAVATVGEDLNVRSGPGTEYDRIGGATAGEEYTITGKSADGEWWQIDFAGQPGWIYGPLVTATDAEGVPVVTPTTTGAQGANPVESSLSPAVAFSSGGSALGVQFEEE